MSFIYNDEIHRPPVTEFPELAFALEHQELRETFDEHEAIANANKRHTRRWGFVAVLLAAVALVIAAFEPVAHGALPHDGAWKYVPKAMTAVAALCGVVAGLVGFFGVRFGHDKEQWLRARLITERLRQWHGQSLLGDAATIAAAAHSEELKAAYVHDREQRFQAFKAEFVDQVDAEWHRYVASEDSKSDTFASRLWQRREWREPPTTLDRKRQPALERLLAAYEAHRLRGQLQYTSFKLRGENQRFWTHAAVQARVLGNLAFLSVTAILLLHAVVFLALFLGFDWISNPLTHATTITLAIVALAGRTLEEGLQPHREVDRLQTYLLQLEAAEARAREATDPQARLEALRAVEEAAYGEMLAFLQAANESRFVM